MLRFHFNRILIKIQVIEDTFPFYSTNWKWYSLLQNVVQFLGYYTSPQLCIVMEYMPLGSLGEYIFDMNKPMNTQLAIKIGFDVVKGMVSTEWNWTS